MQNVEEKVRLFLESQSVKELNAIAKDEGMKIPAGSKKDEIVDEIMNHAATWEDGELEKFADEHNIDLSSDSDDAAEKETETPAETETQEQSEKTEPAKNDPAYIADHNERIASLKDRVAMLAVQHAEKDAEFKAIKKQFESTRDELIEALGQKPEPTLFDVSKRKCRKCGVLEGNGVYFATDDLCRTCADNLGKEGNPELTKEQQEIMNTCPECGGTGFVNGTECINCEGTGKLNPEPKQEAGFDDEPMDGEDKAESGEELEGSGVI